MTPALSCRDVHAAILAGGEGTRLRPLTTVFPKPLVPLADKPIIEILLRRLASHGFRHVTLCTGYLAELVMAVCGDGSQLGLSISYAREPGRLGTAGPLASLDSLSDPFFVMNGDLLTTLDFDLMLQHHVRTGAEATIAIKSRKVDIDFGVIETTSDGLFAQYREKPSFEFDVSMGAYVLNRSVLRHIPRGSRIDMPDLISEVARSGGVVSCYRTDCYWLDIGRMEDYSLAQQQYASDPERFLKAGGP
jgi:NDP-sugar pyrophosphorylase family protein